MGFGILDKFWQQFDWNYRPMAALCTYALVVAK